MDKYILDGVEYIRINGTWLNTSYIVLPLKDTVRLKKMIKGTNTDLQHNDSKKRKIINHCYACRGQIYDNLKVCPKCHWYICDFCGSCGCGYGGIY